MIILHKNTEQIIIHIFPIQPITFCIWRSLQKEKLVVNMAICTKIRKNENRWFFNLKIRALDISIPIAQGLCIIYANIAILWIFAPWKIHFNLLLYLQRTSKTEVPPTFITLSVFLFLQLQEDVRMT